MEKTKVDYSKMKDEIAELQYRLEHLEKERNTILIPDQESTSQQENQEEEKPKEKTRFFASLMLASFITMALMALYETVKQLLHPNITIWQSHFITIFFSGLIAPIGAYVALNKIEALRQKALSELRKRKKVESKLRNYNEELETHIQERTFELTRTNDKLTKEVNMRRQAEEELRNYAEQLLLSRDLLEEKAEQLESLNNQLVQSEKNLQELNASKDKFFSILAHDLRSPFASVVGLSEFLSHEADKLKKTEIKTFTQSIYQSSNTIFKLLENLLQWSQIQTGRAKCTPIVFRINDLILDIIDLFRFTAEKKDIYISIDLADELIVEADKNMINSVVRNLISNALKFTHPGGKILIKTEALEDKARITFEDTGIGMDESKLSKLFRIEENISEEGTQNERGTGLGLILCQDFLKKNNGSIEVSSTKGAGSVFSFTLPLGKN